MVQEEIKNTYNHKKNKKTTAAKKCKPKKGVKYANIYKQPV